MKIFIRGLPADTSAASLRAFAETLLTPPWYLPMSRRIKLRSCVVLKMKDLASKTVEFHGLLEVTPYKSAMDAIERLNRQEFQGRLLAARTWHERVGQNDRRNVPSPEDDNTSKDRRTRNRRRRRLVVGTYEPLPFKGLRGFHRQYE